MLQGTNIKLRALEPEDLDFLFTTENNQDFWEVSGTVHPFSKHILKQYISNAHQSIYEAQQLRFIIDVDKTPVGMVDLFDFDPNNNRAGIGIIILPKYGNKGYASEALDLLITYSFNILQLHQLYANITTDNTRSIQLFSQKNFQKVGCKKDWIYTKNTYKDELLFQLINTYE